jgi:hypothetical protein
VSETRAASVPRGNNNNNKIKNIDSDHKHGPRLFRAGIAHNQQIFRARERESARESKREQERARESERERERARESEREREGFVRT